MKTALNVISELPSRDTTQACLLMGRDGALPQVEPAAQTQPAAETPKDPTGGTPEGAPVPPITNEGTSLA